MLDFKKWGIYPFIPGECFFLDHQVVPLKAVTLPPLNLNSLEVSLFSPQKQSLFQNTMEEYMVRLRINDPDEINSAPSSVSSASLSHQ